MPRTKRPVKKAEKSVEDNDVLKKLNKFVLDQKNKIDRQAQMELRNVEIAFKILLGAISKNYMQKTVGQLKTELHLTELTNTRRTRHSGRSASHDDGYLTENSSQNSGGRAASKQMAPPASARARRSRSADPRARSTQRRRSKSVYKTPSYSKNAAVTFPAITPKVTPATPLAVLRQPRRGEMVVSMQGSPVMVPSAYTSTMQPEDKANCNILLQDGTMLSLQPKQLRQSQAYIPFSLMDSSVLLQLKTLRENLDKVVKMGEKNMK